MYNTGLQQHPLLPPGLGTGYQTEGYADPPMSEPVRERQAYQHPTPDALDFFHHVKFLKIKESCLFPARNPTAIVHTMAKTLVC